MTMKKKSDWSGKGSRNDRGKPMNCEIWWQVAVMQQIGPWVSVCHPLYPGLGPAGTYKEKEKVWGYKLVKGVKQGFEFWFTVQKTVQLGIRRTGNRYIKFTVVIHYEINIWGDIINNFVQYVSAISDSSHCTVLRSQMRSDDHEPTHERILCMGSSGRHLRNWDSTIKLIIHGDMGWSQFYLCFTLFGRSGASDANVVVCCAFAALSAATWRRIRRYFDRFLIPVHLIL